MLSSRYVKMLLDGRKRSTVRPGVLRVSDRLYIHSRGRIVAVAEVSEVVYKRVADLTEEDALLDGFRSREELLQFLKRRYPGIRETSTVTIIRFREVKKVDMPEDSFYGGLSPVEIAAMALNRLKLDRREERILKAVVEAGSLRKASLRLFGTVEKRGIIRRVLRRAASRLFEELGGRDAEGAGAS